MKQLLKQVLTFFIILIFAGSITIALAAATYTVTNTNDSGAGSLRQAILDANANAGLDTIHFNIPGSGPFSITVMSIYPDITDPVVIDGWSQPGYVSTPIVELNGNSRNSDGFRLAEGSSGSTIRGLVINRCYHCCIYLARSSNNTIQGCYLGTDTSGNVDLGSRIRGIELESSDGNQIGGTTPQTRNVISGNDNDGIYFYDSSNNTIEGNIIGLGADGMTTLGNSGEGIAFYTGSNNMIGGTAENAGNIISANGSYGIYLNRYAPGTQVLGNKIGTDISGTLDRGNGSDGIVAAEGHTIGGPGEAAGNIISGNSGEGIRVPGNHENVVIQGNYIGTDITGTLNLGNSGAGIYFQGGNDNSIIGGTQTGAGNRIAFNLGEGVWVAYNCDALQMVGNAIFSNSDRGIRMDSGVHYNNVISRNSIHANGALGIDIFSPVGANPNDAGDTDTGANNLQNYPVITKVVRYSTSVLIEGNLDSVPDKTYTIEFFSSSSLDPSGYGEGETYIGYTSLYIPSAKAVATFSVTLPVTVPAGYYITATATDPDGNTSEFSGGVITPTQALLSDFRAYSGSGGGTVEWTTSSENGTAGFMLMRKGDKDYVPVNQKLLSALPHATIGATYRIIDPTAVSGQTYIYKLLEIESSGKFTVHGPYQTTVDGATIHQASKKRFFRRINQSFSQPGTRATLNRVEPPISSRHKMRLQKRKHFIKQIKWHRKGKRHQTGKITIKDKGMYMIGIQQIAEMLNIPPMQARMRIMGHKFELSNRGRQVSWTPAPGSNGLLFYGEAIDSVYTEQNVYILKAGKGSAMGFSPGGFPQSTEMQTFTDTLHSEEDRITLTALFTDPESDYWLWDYVAAGMGSKDFPFMIYSPAQTDMTTLTVYLKGATPTSHRVSVSLNGTQVGQGTWQGTDAYSLELSINPSLLHNGANTITVANTTDVSVFYMDSFDLSYEKYYHCLNNRLFFNPGENETITIEGFSEKGVLVFDITEPQQPQRVMVRSCNDGRISFRPKSSDRRYVAVGANSMWQPLTVTGMDRAKLRRKQNTADYLVIIPQGFQEAAAKLTTLRQASGLDTMVVELEDIYNEFNHGIEHPEAIRRFLKYTYNHWRNGAPRYVVLAGDGSYDYRNNQQHSDCLVPPVMVSTPYGLFATDNLYGDVAGEDGVPEIAVGRIPVLTPDELKVYVGKLSRTEESQGEWRSRLLFLADDGDPAGSFPQDSDGIAKLLTSYQVDKVYLPDFATVEEARVRLFASWNSGAAVVNFIGHAGLVNLTSEGLFQTGDVGLLQNTDRCGVMAGFTCMMGRFSVPGYETLSETLVMHPLVGSVACWSPTGMSLNYLAVDLAQGFYQQMASSAEKSLGEMILEAKARFGQDNPRNYMLHIYNLLGDPALKIK